MRRGKYCTWPSEEAFIVLLLYQLFISWTRKTKVKPVSKLYFYSRCYRKVLTAPNKGLVYTTGISVRKGFQGSKPSLEEWCSAIYTW